MAGLRRCGLGVLLAFACAVLAPAAYSQTLTYDDLGRLATAAYADGTNITYCYDNVGNRKLYTVTTGSGGGCVPVANNVSQMVVESTANNPIALIITGATPTAVHVSTAASHGTATASGVSITYTPTSGYVGTDSFQYTAQNTLGTSAPATVSINIVTAGGTILFTQTTAGAYSYTIPAGVTLVTVEAWGGGGGGGIGSNPILSHGGGGGGGGYTASTIAVSPGSVIAGSVGAGGVGANSGAGATAGGDTTVTTPTINAGGGSPGASETGGAGGSGATTSGQSGAVPTGGLAGNTTSSPPGGGGLGEDYGGIGGSGATGEIIIINATPASYLWGGFNWGAGLW